MSTPVVAEIYERDSDDPAIVTTIARYTGSNEGPAELDVVDSGTAFAVEHLLQHGIDMGDDRVLTAADGVEFVRALPMVIRGSRLWAGLPDTDAPLDRWSRDALVGFIRHRRVEGQRADALEAEYVRRLPATTVSRCPFTAQPVELGIDVFGFDGPWWAVDKPLRRVDAPPPTFAGMSGAVADAPLDAIAGPRRSFVHTRRLEREGTVAVLSTIQVGEHAAVVTTYFSMTAPTSGELIPEWGAPWARLLQADGTWDWTWVERAPGPIITELTAQIEAGRILWIAPGDPDFALHKGLAECPYIS